MLIEKRMQKVLDKIIKKIQVATDILDMSGFVVASSDKERVGYQELFIKTHVVSEGKNNFIYSGKTYMKFVADRNFTYYIAMEGTSKVIRNYCILAISLIELYSKSISPKVDRESIMRGVLLDRVSDLEFQEFVLEQNIAVERLRCAFVMRTASMKADQIYQIMINAFPKNQGDFLVLVDSRTVVLLKHISDDLDEGELIQLAGAIEETILSEVSIKAYVGIGKCKNSIYNITDSYREAVQAIEIGNIYEPNSTIYLYDALLLERFLYEVPLKNSEKYFRHIFHEEFEKTLNDEMIATIEKFFENSLNLSETSRQLYIHRNTLVYRLDKVQKVLGLDLRNFHDAVTFKIMMMLERQNRECSN